MLNFENLHNTKWKPTNKEDQKDMGTLEIEIKDDYFLLKEDKILVVDTNKSIILPRLGLSSIAEEIIKNNPNLSEKERDKLIDKEMKNFTKKLNKPVKKEGRFVEVISAFNFIADNIFRIDVFFRNEENIGKLRESRIYELVNEKSLKYIYCSMDFNTEKGEFELNQETLFYSPLKNKK